MRVWYPPRELCFLDLRLSPFPTHSSPSDQVAALFPVKQLPWHQWPPDPTAPPAPGETVTTGVTGPNTALRERATIGATDTTCTYRRKRWVERSIIICSTRWNATKTPEESNWRTYQKMIRSPCSWIGNASIVQMVMQKQSPDSMQCPFIVSFP